MVLLKLNLVFVFVDGQPSSMNVKVLVFVLARQIALLSLQVFHVLLFEAQFKVFHFRQLLLILSNRLTHAIFFTLDQEEFHFDSLLHVSFSQTHSLFFLEHGLTMCVGSLF